MNVLILGPYCRAISQAPEADLEEVEQLPFLDLGCPREEVHKHEVRASESHEDSPETPDPTPFTWAEAEFFEILVAIAPHTDIASICCRRVEQLRGCRACPGAGVSAAILTRRRNECMEVRLGTADWQTLGDGHQEAAE